MKMLKKAAAVLLAAAMSLTMLTACGGGSGSGSGSTGLVRDTAKEDQLISWAQEYAQANNSDLKLEKSEGVSNAAAAGLADAKLFLDIQTKQATGDANAAYASMMKACQASLSSQNKSGAVMPLMCAEKDFTKENVVKAFDALMPEVEAKFQANKIEPKTVGAAVTVQNGNVYMVVIVAN